jgi:hypothetical protein
MNADDIQAGVPLAARKVPDFGQMLVSILRHSLPALVFVALIAAW